jgi:hypothetical protein
LKIGDVIVIVVKVNILRVIFFFYRLIWVSLILNSLSYLAASKTELTFGSAFFDVWIREEIEKRFFLSLTGQLIIIKLPFGMELLRHFFVEGAHYLIRKLWLKPNENFGVIIKAKGHLNEFHLV